MDSAWNQQQSPLKPGEVENDIDEKPNYQKKARSIGASRQAYWIMPILVLFSLVMNHSLLLKIAIYS
jgi:hypothetical protein